MDSFKTARMMHSWQCISVFDFSFLGFSLFFKGGVSFSSSSSSSSRSKVPDIVSMAKVLCTHEERDMCMAFAGRVSVSHGHKSRSTSWVCLFWQSQGNNAAQLIIACKLRES